MITRKISIPAQGRNEDFKFQTPSISALSSMVSVSGGGGGGVPGIADQFFAFDIDKDALSIEKLAVGDLIITGTVNHWLGDTITVDDANLQLNRRQGGATVSSGLIIYNKDTQTEVSKLEYDTAGVWRAGGQRIYTDAYRPLSDNSTALGGFAASLYPRKAENASITGLWTINRSGENTTLLRFNIERAWRFMQTSTGSTTGIAFVSEVDQKDFDIRHTSGNRAAIFGVSSSNATVYLTPDGGNVGIGIPRTSPPSERLHVAGNAMISGNTRAQRFIGTNDSSNDTVSSGHAKFDGYGVLVNRAVAYFCNGGNAISFHTNATAHSRGNRPLRLVGLNADFGGDLTGSTTFSSGFAGSGWRLESGAENHLTLDRLTVRGRMDIYELVVNQIRGTNGALWVSDSAKVSSVSGNRLTIDTGGDTSFVPFVVNDLLRCQRWNGNNVKYYVVRVTAVGSNYIDVALVDGSSPREAGDHLVRMGNTTVTDRQGAIYLTSSDSNAPYLDVLDGVNSASFAGKVKVRLGRLDGIVDADLGTLSGYGLFSENVYLKGAIVANSGRIGGASIENGGIGTNLDNNKFIGMVSLTASNATIGGFNSFLRRGFGIYNYDSATTAGGFKLMRMGMLANKDSANIWPATPNYGIQIGTGTGSAYRDVFRVDKDGALIAGVNFNHQSIWTNRWALNADGSGSFADGKISWTAGGVMTIESSLITQHITTDYIQGLELNFTKGTIGGFKIGTSSLIGGNPNGDRFVLYPDYSGFAAFISADNTKWAGIGSNVLPAGAGGALGRFENLESKVLGTNIGLVVRVQNAQRNIAMTGMGDVYMDGEIVGSKHNFYFYASTSVIILGQFRATWLIQAAANAGSGVSLPRINDIRTELGLSTSTPFAVRVSYIGHRNSSKNIIIWGRNTTVSGMSGTEFPQILNNNANNSNGMELGRGDIQEFMLVFDGVNYSAYLLNYRV